MALVTRRQKFGLWTTAMLATLAVAYALLIFLPRQRVLAKKHRELHQRQRFIVVSERMRTALRASQLELDQLQTICRRWEPIERLRRHLPTLFARLTETASQHRLSVLQLTPGDPTPLKTIQRQPVELLLEGEFADILAYASDIDQIPEFAWVDEVALHPDPNDRDMIQCRMKLTVFTGFSGSSEKSE